MILTARSYAAPANYRVVEIDVGRRVNSIHFGPRRPGALKDVFVHSDRVVRIWWQRKGAFAKRPDEVLALPIDPSLVDFGDVCRDAGHEVVVLTRTGVLADDHRAVLKQRHSGAGGVFGSRPRASDPGGVFQRLSLAKPASVRRGAAIGRGGPIPLPFEHSSTSFLLDINNDDKVDLIVPRQNRYEIYLRKGTGFVPTVFLQADHQLELHTGGPDLIDPLRHELEVPQLDVHDVNGDGLLDVVSAVGEKRIFFLQKPDGFTFEPSYELDLARFRGEPRQSRSTDGLIRRGDMKFLEKAGVYLHERDIDGDGRDDYLISAGQVIRVFFGGERGTDFSRPHLARKMSSEVQGVGGFDVNDDGVLDLVALKFEFPSVARMIAAYFVSTSLDFEVLAYINKGGRNFSRRPDRRRVLTLNLPPFRSILEDFDRFAAEILEAITRRSRYETGDVNGDGARDAVFVEDDGTLKVFFGRTEKPGDIPSTIGLGDLFFGSRQTYWELQEFLDFVSGAAQAAARKRVAGRLPDVQITLGKNYSAFHELLELHDLNADDKLDFALLSKDGRLKLILSLNDDESSKRTQESERK